MRAIKHAIAYEKFAARLNNAVSTKNVTNGVNPLPENNLIGKKLEEPGQRVAKLRERLKKTEEKDKDIQSSRNLEIIGTGFQIDQQKKIIKYNTLLDLPNFANVKHTRWANFEINKNNITEQDFKTFLNTNLKYAFASSPSFLTIETIIKPSDAISIRKQDVEIRLFSAQDRNQLDRYVQDTQCYYVFLCTAYGKQYMIGVGSKGDHTNTTNVIEWKPTNGGKPSLKALRHMASKIKLPNRSKMCKSELAAALEKHKMFKRK
jgi:hypothetical protein